MRKVLYVSPSDGDWKVHWQHDDKGSVFKRKEDAIADARKKVSHLPEGECSQIRVQKADGTFQTEWTYGDDPFPPGG